jgi:amidohydrolase
MVDNSADRLRRTIERFKDAIAGTSDDRRLRVKYWFTDRKGAMAMADPLTPEALGRDGRLLRSIRESAEAASPRVLTTARQLEARAERSWEERRTTSWLARRYRGLGFKVERVKGEPGFIARIGPARSAHPPVALRCELDGVPTRTGAAHLCGHDLHMAAVLEAARILAELSARFGLQVIVIGQPAEEAGTPHSGAPAMIRRGALQFGTPKAAAVLAFHGTNNMRSGKIAVLYGGGPFYAGFAGVKAMIDAPGGHPGRPQTIPTLEVFLDFIGQVEAAIRATVPLDASFHFRFNAINVGERTGSKVPTHGEAHGELRWYDQDLVTAIESRVDEVVRRFEHPSGTTVGIEFNPGYRPTVVDAGVARIMAQAAGHVSDVVAAEPSLFAEDVGEYWRQGGVPVGFVDVGTGDQDYPPDRVNPYEHHSPAFKVSPEAQANLWRAVYVLAVSALMVAAGF